MGFQTQEFGTPVLHSRPIIYISICIYIYVYKSIHSHLAYEQEAISRHRATLTGLHGSWTMTGLHPTLFETQQSKRFTSNYAHLCHEMFP